MSFLAPWFAVAGLAVAAGPVLIHLLNRRRYRTLEWAAMDFLREAVRRSRRFLRIRDLLLLILRTAFLLLFGLAMARPYWAAATATVDPDQPVHGILLLDNSLSMSYQELDGTLLDEAKRRARQWIERLPPGSRVSVVPLCGSRHGLSLAPGPGKEDALEMLNAVEVMDRGTSPGAALDLALETSRWAPELPAKQIVLIGDAQVVGGSCEPLSAQLARLPAPVQTMLVAPKQPENAWIAQFKLQDEVADLQSPAVFLATIGYQGPAPRPNVQVTLSLDGVTVATATVDLLPGQAREIQFPPYQFQVPVEPGRPTLVTAEVSLAHDRLPIDDQRFLVVPVVAALPVVFIDQYGEREDPRRNQFGETAALRRLLAPVTANKDSQRQLIHVRRATIEQVDQDLLHDARLVVVAGVSNPGPAVSVLRQYVAQGGPLVIAAGGDFDPAAWTVSAWLDGAGILPAPLQPQFVGHLPDESGGGALAPFQIDVHSLVHDYFLLDQVPREELEDLYRLPYFFKAAVPDVSDEALKPLLAAAAEKPGADQALPGWLLWGGSLPVEDLAQLAPADRVARARPRVLAEFTNHVPYLVEGRIGQGRVLLVSGGFSPRWGTIALCNTMLIYDRILRDLLLHTFPVRNLTTDESHVEPIAPADRFQRFTLTLPDGRQEALAVDALGKDRYAVALRNPTRRGIYRVGAASRSDTAENALKLWEIPLAVNGPADESKLLPPLASTTRTAAGDDVWTAQGGKQALFEQQAGGAWLWRFGMLAAMCCLLVELAVLAMPILRQERSA